LGSTAPKNSHTYSGDQSDNIVIHEQFSFFKAFSEIGEFFIIFEQFFFGHHLDVVVVDFAVDDDFSEAVVVLRADDLVLRVELL
jgi:hypothetical protein